MSLGARLRKLREARGLTGRAAAVYLNISSAHVSDLENDKANPSLDLISRLASYYRTTTDYLLGLTDDPSPRRDKPLPETVRELVELAEGLSPGRQDELLAHARVLDEAELQADLRAYDRAMALVMALPEGDLLRESVEEALRAGAGGDTAAALRVIDAFLAGRAAKAEAREEEVEQG